MLDYEPMYRRVLLKISGEQLAGQFDGGVDPAVVNYFAEEVKKIVDTGCQLVIVAGGGNVARGTEVAKHGIRRVTGDHMGMLGGLINAIAMTDVFEHHDIATRCLSNVFADQVAESYSYRRADKHLSQNRVVIVAAGIGRPYFTHDTAAVNIALELDCEVVLKATKVDGIYDKDPAKHPNATKFEELRFQQAVEDENIKVMDKAALGLAMEQNMPVIVYNSKTPDNLLKICQGEKIGTLVK